MLKFAMIIGLLYMGYRLVTKPNTSEIDSNQKDSIEEEFTDYEEID